MLKDYGGVPILIVANVLGFMLTSGPDQTLLYNLALWPLQDNFMPWQLLTYAFLHGGFMHLAFNMYGLWLFGTEMESLLGRQTFLKLYFASVLSAAAM